MDLCWETKAEIPKHMLNKGKVNHSPQAGNTPTSEERWTRKPVARVTSLPGEMLQKSPITVSSSILSTKKKISLKYYRFLFFKNVMGMK